ncbi:MAG: PorV/PorQ family protein [bacterium]
MKNLIIIFLLVFLYTIELQAVSQAAIPTIQLAPGGRATALGEAGVAQADDAFAPFYNPAGLGLGPLSHTWQTYLSSGNIKKSGNTALKANNHLTALAAKKDLKFAEKPVIWLGTEEGLFKFNGKEWVDNEIFYIEQNETMEKIVANYINDMAKEKEAVDSVKQYNGLKTAEDADQLIDFKIPFRTAIRQKVTALAVEQTGRLWVGTEKGVYLYDGKKWRRYSTSDGLVDDTVTTIAISLNNIWVGTRHGASLYKGGLWKSYTREDGLSDNYITSIEFGVGKTVWIGTKNGLNKFRGGGRFTIIDTSVGLLESNIKGLSMDSERNLWIAMNSTVTRLKGKKWKNFKFKDTEINCISVDKENFIWIGTDKGVIRLKEGKETINFKGEKVIKDADNKHFHDKNGLISNNVMNIVPQMKDVWFLTEKGISRYNKAERQISLFYEQLLPAFGLEDLYHMYASMIWPTEDWGTLAGFLKYISFGVNDWTNELGSLLGQFRAFDAFGGFSYGTTLLQKMALGISIKFIYSQLSPGWVHVGAEKGSGIAISYATDAGILFRDILPNTDLGINLQNMGPHIFYIDKEQEDPIPFNLRLGTAFRIIENPIHKLLWVFEFNRELVKRNIESGKPDAWYQAIWSSWIPQEPYLSGGKWYEETLADKFKEAVYSTGFEYWYSNFAALRAGTMYDKAGTRGELTFGLGLNINNLLMDFSYIVGSQVVDKTLSKLKLMEPWVGNDDGSARNGEMQFSIIFVF